MANVGHAVALKSAAKIQEKLIYLENGLHPNHVHYKQPDRVRTWGIADSSLFISLCERLLERWNQQHPLHCGPKPKVKAYWWMPRFADKVVLEPRELRRVEQVILSVLPPGCVAVYNWHIPDHSKQVRRKKGPDFNFLCSNGIGKGMLKDLSRDSGCSMWGLLRDALEYVVAELNLVRAARGLRPIPTMREARERKRERGKRLRLCVQLSKIPGADKDLEGLQHALSTLGYVARTCAAQRLWVRQAPELPGAADTHASKTIQRQGILRMLGQTWPRGPTSPQVPKVGRVGGGY